MEKIKNGEIQKREVAGARKGRKVVNHSVYSLFGRKVGVYFGTRNLNLVARFRMIT